ncbi:class I SAM-dependent methyltransferase [Ensifer sp. Root31]|uniref:class I SAM-dependent DNA methyltransferase n=1 Tax=Ensifer sp. Root31 TaxID=1736512 RepID=UPI003297E621
MTVALDDPLYTDPSLAEFYDAENGWGHDLTYCGRLAQDCVAVLDLGCGTGLFLTNLDCKERVGVDRARAMLDIARSRPNGGGVNWVEGDARDVRLGRQFDLIVLTGHAFQVFLDTDDQRAVLETISLHLAPDGRFIFDSRNPDRREWEEWQPEHSKRELDHQQHGSVMAWNAARLEDDKSTVTYDTFYRFPDGRELSGSSQIRFTPKECIADLLTDARLKADVWLGDWDGRPFSREDPEIIVIGSHASAGRPLS